MKITLCVLLFFCMKVLIAQNTQQQNNTGGIAIRGGFGNEISIADVNGRPFERKYVDVEGTPFYFQDYRIATIRLINGNKYDSVSLKIDLFVNQINVVTTDKKEFYLPAGSVSSVFFTGASTNDSAFNYFKCGFPAVGELTASNFYQVLVDGKCSLLKSTTKKLSVRKNDMSGEETKEFVTYENYFVFLNLKMDRVKKDKSALKNELQDKHIQIENFIEKNKINTKDENDLISVIKYYNNL